MSNEADSVAVRVLRGAHEDAVHSASVAVVDARGELVHAHGDPARPVVIRSAAKPFQALPLVATGAADALGLGPHELALASSSHNGSDLHVAGVRRLLALAGVGPEALRCGAHLPIELRLRGAYPTHGEDKDPLRHNCSGKHAGFLALARQLGAAPDSYLDPDGAVQIAVRRAIEDACELAAGSLVAALDGCSAPTYAMPLVALAVGFKNLALGRAADATESRALTRVRDAMQAAPLLVSGEGRFDYDLARSFPDNVVNKGGAEAVLGLGFRDPPLGIALKVHDGGERALAPLAVAVLRELGLVPDLARVPLLARHERPALRNYAGLLVGEIRARVTLR
ncbi:MAG TPA: asparaginase [Polyangiaceae bacterium]|nr:asparaginase [Polyangiaceae bacterium]